MSKSKLIEFASKGKKKQKNESILDHGRIGGLNYELYGRGTIHIFDAKKKGLRFKKDPALFEEALDEIGLETLGDGDEAVLEAAGDNPDLIFKKKDGDIILKLRQKEYGTITKLKNLLKKAKGRKKRVK